MRLCEHPDFDQAVIRAADHFRRRGLRALVIEKDYYVTEALRLVANSSCGAHVIFKGGTSLSKGWSLIDRFSEDVDLFLDPATFSPALGRRALERKLSDLRDAVAAHSFLALDASRSRSIRGKGGDHKRDDFFTYVSVFGATGDVEPRILLECGTASGRQPTERRVIRSYLAQYLDESGVSLEAADRTGFEMNLLHYRRTFIEKLFALHSKVALVSRDAGRIGPYARHYYDLYMLSQQQDVVDMIFSDECREIKEDYDRISREFYPRDYVAPDQLSFANSDAFFPSGDLAEGLKNDYQDQCAMLCFGSYPPWEEIRARFDSLRAGL